MFEEIRIDSAQADHPCPTRGVFARSTWAEVVEKEIVPQIGWYHGLIRQPCVASNEIRRNSGDPSHHEEHSSIDRTDFPLAEHPVSVPRDQKTCARISKKGAGAPNRILVKNHSGKKPSHGP